MNLAAQTDLTFADGGRQTQISTLAAPWVVLAAVDINAVIDKDN